ncbi:MAG: GspE/PulE family protein [Candidatus Riflebacteria bacterium]|nr:GspE/PulE family protein [Candidatus Riflebacteria bacterium]
MAKEIEKKLKFEEKLRDLTYRLLSCGDVGAFLLQIRAELVELFNVHAFSIFLYDKESGELRSRYSSNADIEEIHIPIDQNSIAGYVAHSREVIQLTDVYDSNELKSISVSLKFDKRWDKLNNFRTQSVLAVPIDFQSELLGVFELINKLDGETFTTFDRSAAHNFSKTLGLAIYNVKRSREGKILGGKFDYLVMNNNITQSELFQAIQIGRSSGENLESILEKRFKVEKTYIRNALSFFYKKRFIPFQQNFQIATSLLRDLKPDYLRKNLWVPVRQGIGEVCVLVVDPNDMVRMDSIPTVLKNIKYNVFLSSQEDIFRYIDQWELGGDQTNKSELRKPGLAPFDEPHLSGKISQTKFAKPMPQAEQVIQPESFIDGDFSETDGVIVRLANQIIEEAYIQGVSDIHLEPYRGKETLIRFRKDGSCYTAKNLPYNHAAPLISRFKIMANIDISQKRLPQDGKIKTSVNGKEVELRVATMPTVNDQEDAVLRILASSEPWPLEKLNLLKIHLNKFKEALEKPYGMILVVGPTGSGKTTTLHAGLGYLNHPQKKIWTAEDPVEITQYGLRQVQINNKAGLTFAAAMRSFLRANPDVIMVGEMRDVETASIAIEASLTGHLVLSTLHTNSAPETVNRLLDMGLEPIYFAEALIGIMGQRLVKTFCPSCKVPFSPSSDEKNQLINEFGKALWEKYIKIPLELWDKHFHMYKAAGCEKCNFTGYSGRMGIYEYLQNTDELKRLIHSKAKVSDIRERAIEEGMFTLKMDGIIKVINGETSLQQILAAAMK